MRIGFTTDAHLERLGWAQSHGFGSIEWMGFSDGFAGPGKERWRADAQAFAAEAGARNIRISAIGALYRNPLDPAQSDHARAVFHRAIAVAALIGVRTVAGFPGAVIESTLDPRGGHPKLTPLENFLPQIAEFWRPIARDAADQGVRLAFEHCPQGTYHLPAMHYNILGQPALWDRFFDELNCDNAGLEWDASHLICQFVDPIANLRKFGSKIFHIHAKDAYINRELLEAHGICHHGVAEHRWPGFGQSNWAEIIHTLHRLGYDSDLTIEGWHDPVFRNHAPEAGDPKYAVHPRLVGRQLEDAGLLMAKRWLEPFVPREA